MELFASWVREQPDPIKKSWECPVQFTTRTPYLLRAACWQQSVHEHVTLANKCFRNVSLRVSVFFHPFYHMCSRGNNTGLCCSLFTAEGMFWDRQCVELYCWREEREWVPEREGFWRLSIFWCARWITSRVGLHNVRLPYQLMFPLHSLPDGGMPKILKTTTLIVVH